MQILPMGIMEVKKNMERTKVNTLVGRFELLMKKLDSDDVTLQEIDEYAGLRMTLEELVRTPDGQCANPACDREIHTHRQPDWGSDDYCEPCGLLLAIVSENYGHEITPSWVLMAGTNFSDPNQNWCGC